MAIPEIKISNVQVKPIQIENLNINQVLSAPSVALPPAPPVVVNVGVPLIDIPGCVEAHEVDDNNMLEEDDPKGTEVFCDGNMPSFNPIDYSPENLVFTRPEEIPKVNPPETPELPEAPDTSKVEPATAKIDCPTKVQQAQEPVGTYVNGFRERVTGYELIDKTCVQITEEVPLPRQIVEGLPSGGQVVQVGGVAVIATTSALLAKPLADLLLKVVKPTVKKVLKKVATLRGKKIPVQSVRERLAEQRQRNQAVKTLRSVRPLKK